MTSSMNLLNLVLPFPSALMPSENIFYLSAISFASALRRALTLVFSSMSSENSSRAPMASSLSITCASLRPSRLIPDSSDSL
nr:MAG TPA: hypothetical protein [Bacteriophage sp.]